MTLRDWLIREGRSVPWLAEKLRVHRTTVYAWLRDEKTPRADRQREIARLTMQQVLPADWVPL